jgi:hypothetical protein
MQFMPLSARIAIALSVALCVPDAASAQMPKPGETAVSTSLSGVYQFDTDLDHGGDFHFAAGIASGAIAHGITSDFSVGLKLRYDYEDWQFAHPARFGGAAPWSHLNAPGFIVDLNYAAAPDLVLGLAPVFGWSYESGAKVGDALAYGAIVTATKVYSPSLVLGLGAGVIRQVDETKVFPFLIVRWQIDERWRLENPFPAGPAGGVGLELTYSPDERWDFAVGGAYRSTRFRLDDHGAGDAGVGAYRFYPLFARIARKFGPRTSVDLYAGVALGGRLSVTDASGTTIAKDDYSAAPLLGLTLSHRY